MSSLIATYPGPGSPSGIRYAMDAIEYGVRILDDATGGVSSTPPLWERATIIGEGGSLSFAIAGLEWAVSTIEVRLGGTFGALLTAYPGTNSGGLSFCIARLEYVVDALWDQIGPAPTPTGFISRVWAQDFAAGVPTTTPFNGSVLLATATPQPGTYTMSLTDPDSMFLLLDNGDGSWGIYLNAELSVPSGIGVGVNTHVEYTDGSYANVAAWCALLVQLGRPLVRQQAPLPSFAGQEGWPTLIATGCLFNLVCNIDGSDAVVPPLTLMTNVQAQFADSSRIVSIEGPNELNNAPGATYTDRFGTPHTGTDCAIPWMNDWLFYKTSNQFFADIPLVNCVSFPAIAPPVGTTYSNAHPYPHNGDDPEATFEDEIAQQAQGLPILFTEFGYTTGNNSNPSDDVTPTEQSTLLMSGLAEAKTLGVRQVYLYELLDQKDADPLWGIYHTDYTPKPVVAPLTAYIASQAAVGAGYYEFTWHAVGSQTLVRADILNILAPGTIIDGNLAVPNPYSIDAPIDTEVGIITLTYGPRSGNLTFVPQSYSLSASIGTTIGAFV